MEMIDQLVYTWSDVGLSGQTAGFRLRAASDGLRDPRSERYTRLEAYLPYNLPPGIRARSVSAIEAPVCLAFIDTGRERILVRKELLDADAAGRPGAYLTHLLAGLPAKFTARDAILLWHTDEFWITAQNPLNSQQFSLPQLTIDELRNYPRTPWKGSSLSHFQASLNTALAHFLRSSSPQRLCLSGSSEAIAALIWGVTQSFPCTLFPRMTFNTYEDDLNASQETIVGLFADRFLPPDGLSFNVDIPPRHPYSGETDTTQQFITFASKALYQNLHATQPNHNQLTALVSLAEQRKVRTVDALLELFKEQQNHASVAQIVEPKQERQGQSVSIERIAKLKQEWQGQNQEVGRNVPAPVNQRVEQLQIPPQRNSIPTPPERPLVPSKKTALPVEPPHKASDKTISVPPPTVRPDPVFAPPPTIQPDPVSTPNRIRTVFIQFRQDLDHARPLRILHRGTVFSLLLNALLLATLIILLIALPISQNAARQSGINSAFAQMTTTTASAQKQATKTTTQTQATFTAETNRALFIPQNNWTVSAKNGTPFIFSVEVMNTGTRIWLPQQNYQLKCIPITSNQQPVDSDCLPGKEDLARVNVSVLPQQSYIFSFSVTSTGRTLHHLKVQMFQGQTEFTTKSLVLSFTIT